jgi:hypothetical protein
VLFGLVLVARPPDGETALSLVVAALGLYAFVVGVSGLVSAFAVRAFVAEVDAALGGRSPALEAARVRAEARAAGKREARAKADVEKPHAVEKPHDADRPHAAEKPHAAAKPAGTEPDPSGEAERREP